MAEHIKPSFWESEVYFREYDVLIIGSGIVGLSTALSLIERQKALRIAIIDKGTIPTGASTRNAGFACFGSISELLSDLGTMSRDALKELINMRYSGLQRLFYFAEKDNIDYEQTGGYEYFTDSDILRFDLCRANIGEMNVLIEESIGLPKTYGEVDAGQVGIHSDFPLIINQYEGQLHPAKLVKLLIRKARKSCSFFFGAEVEGVDENEEVVRVRLTDSRTIETKFLIHATNGFVKHLPNLKDIEPVRNQVYVTSELKHLNWTGCFHVDEGYIYFRNVGRRILIGGARNIFPEENEGVFCTTDRVRKYLYDFVRSQLKVNEKFQFEYGWSGIMAVGSQKKPIIKKISDRQVVGVRMGGMGVAIGSLVGEKLAEITLAGNT